MSKHLQEYYSGQKSLVIKVKDNQLYLFLFSFHLFFLFLNLRLEVSIMSHMTWYSVTDLSYVTCHSHKTYSHNYILYKII